MEITMIQTFNYNITMPSSFRFLQIYSRVIGFEQGIEFNMSQYLLELALLNIKMLKYQPSMLAASALYLTQKITKKVANWPLNMMDMPVEEIRSCAKEMCSDMS